MPHLLLFVFLRFPLIFPSDTTMYLYTHRNKGRMTQPGFNSGVDAVISVAVKLNLLKLYD